MVISGPRFSWIAKYRNFWTPKTTSPPYLHVCQVGDPVLRTKAENIPPEDATKPHIQKIINHMVNVMRKYKGVGIAAPQIGIPLRIIALEFSEKYKSEIEPAVFKTREMSVLPLLIIVNPVMKVINYEKVSFPEGCLSVIGYSAMVPRYKAVEVTGLDHTGAQQTLETSGYMARMVQHEMDHLDGKLYIDSMDTCTFENSAWHKINVHCGRVDVSFYER